jgi:hypothetical protein
LFKTVSSSGGELCMIIDLQCKLDVRAA